MRKIILLALTFTLLISIFGVIAVAENTEAEMDIEYCNLSFRDSVCVKYAVKSNVSDIKILIWNSPQEEYVIGTQEDEITSYYNEEINGILYKIFDYTALTAKQMTDVVYARAYAKVDDIEYYSAINKYSILQYAYNKLGKTDTASSNTELKEMLENMLSYGASAQQYFDYKEDRLATGDWYQIKVASGVLDDGCTHGLYLTGDNVTLIASETDAEGDVFSHWVNKNGKEIATSLTHELTVEAENEIYTPIYKHQHTVVIDAAVVPTCSTSGLTEGSHCLTCGEVIVVQEVVEATGNHAFSEWLTIKEATTMEEGIMERVCACGEKETKIIEKIVPELDYKLNADGQSYSVIGIGNCTGPELVIPSVYNGLPVTGIGARAFSGCSDLTTISIPDGITNIGEQAFLNCSSLQYNEYNNAYYLGNDDNPYIALVKANSVTSLSINQATKMIADKAFLDCSNMTTITIPDGVISIGTSAFKNCSSLTRVYIPNSVTIIGDEVFYGCSKLTRINIPDGITCIGTRMFFGCGELIYITVPDSLISVGGGAFSACNKLQYNAYNNAYYLGNDDNPYVILVKAKSTSVQSCQINNATKIILANAFSQCSYLTSITIPDGVVFIGDGAFGFCSKLKSITIPDSATYIGDSAFSGCRSLTGITIPDGVTNIGERTFQNCISLTSVTIPNGVMSIGEGAFYACSSLTSVTIPDSVTKIDYYAFYDCSSLKSIKYRGSSAQWLVITKRKEWDYNTGSYTITYNYNGL